MSFLKSFALMGTSTSADSLQNGIVRDFRKVSTLDIGGDTVQSSSQGILGGGVNHLGSDWSGIWRPGEEDDLGSFTLVTIDFVFEIVDGVKTVVFWQFFQKGVVRRIVRSFPDDDFGLSIVQPE